MDGLICPRNRFSVLPPFHVAHLAGAEALGREAQASASSRTAVKPTSSETGPHSVSKSMQIGVTWEGKWISWCLPG